MVQGDMVKGLTWPMSEPLVFDIMHKWSFTSRKAILCFHLDSYCLISKQSYRWYGWRIAMTSNIVLATLSACWHHAQAGFHMKRLSIPFMLMSTGLSQDIANFDMSSLRITILCGWWTDWSLGVLMFNTKVRSWCILSMFSDRTVAINMNS